MFAKLSDDKTAILERVPVLENTTQVAATLISVAEAILAMPAMFYERAMEDAWAVEDMGFSIDARAACNFILMANNRLGFVDLASMPHAKRVAPYQLANALANPAFNARYALNMVAEELGLVSYLNRLPDPLQEMVDKTQDLQGRIVARVIRACDDMGLEFASANEGTEAELRAKFADQYGIGERPHALRSLIKRDGDRNNLYGHAP
jgi:hypothetical protein